MEKGARTLAFIDFLRNAAARADEDLGNAIEPFRAGLVGECREFTLRFSLAEKSRVRMLKFLRKPRLFLALLTEPARAVVIKKL